ncbi:unnamed protein product [Gadus morhua 'NCC']
MNPRTEKENQLQVAEWIPPPVQSLQKSLLFVIRCGDMALIPTRGFLHGNAISVVQWSEAASSDARPSVAPPPQSAQSPPPQSAQSPPPSEPPPLRPRSARRRPLRPRLHAAWLWRPTRSSSSRRPGAPGAPGPGQGVDGQPSYLWLLQSGLFSYRRPVSGGAGEQTIQSSRGIHLCRPVDHEDEDLGRLAHTVQVLVDLAPTSRPEPLGADRLSTAPSSS